MSDVTTVQLSKTVVRALKGIKRYPRETYNDLILDLIKATTRKSSNQYDEFIHNVQQGKMKELWDNKEDEAWENA
jgi:S-adenosylmethionine:diacylglycerol 3-amino-3-carboxypropyl transferase